jgi:F0F1-type ATP synthase assembly protein I
MPKSSEWQPLMGLLSVGTVLVAAILIGWYVGNWIDRRLGIGPWGMVSGVLLGTAAGFVELFRVVKKLGQ